MHADLMKLPFPPNSFDGAYNLGVMEHFTRSEIARILGELRRVIKPGGKLVLFWPHSRATSVFVLNTAHWVMNDVLGRSNRLHPREVSLLKSRQWVEEMLQAEGFNLCSFKFGAADFWVQAVLVAEKRADAA
jgi:ubiquinone/menaquinone biosynthesis C-methylase UbiE